MEEIPRPVLGATVLDTEDVPRLAEFYRVLLGWDYASNAGPESADAEQWRTLRSPDGVRLAFQRVDALPRSSWPSTEVPQQIHLDLTVGTVAQLTALRPRLLAFGATVLRDDAEDPQEHVIIAADPAGHPFCVFVP